MVQSVIDDIKAQFRYGNMVVRIILVNGFVFLAVVLIKAFSPGGEANSFFQDFLGVFALSSETIDLLWHPWSLITHMFLHVGLWHLFWNMILLYWFGKIAGDLIGDKRIFPLYILGGLCGAFFYLVYALVTGQLGIAYGASAAVMAFVVASGFVAPEYNMRLILLGNVKLKYIALALVLIDLLMIAENNNTGGRVAHLGGALFGAFYIYNLRQGTDLAKPFYDMATLFERKDKARSLTVIHRRNKERGETRELSTQERIDQILDKINESGYDSLTDEEKEFLYQASKN